MKFSLAISIIFIGLAAILGWRNHHQLVEAEAAYAEAKALHVSVPPADSDGPTRHRQSRPRQSAADPDALGGELITLVRSLRSGTEPADTAILENGEQQILDLQKRLTALDARRMKALIEEISTAEISDEIQTEILYLLFESLTENHPLVSLELLGESPDLLAGYPRLSVVNQSLERGMTQDSAATIEWFQANRGLLSGSDADSMLATFLCSASSLDPNLAFALIPRIEISDTEKAVGIIAHAARTPEARERVLTAFRDFLKTIPDPAIRDASEFEGLSSLVYSAGAEGLNRALPWLEKSFSPTEIEKVAIRTFPTFVSEDTARWLTWLNQVTPTENVINYTITQTFFGWTGNDYQAAEKWMSELPEGTTKSAVAATFARTVATHQPDKASEWIQSLPPEKQPEVVKSILDRWPPSDPAGAAAFAEKNGIP